ncbi:hypothetical protein SDC9_109703 [bioreactor metagenome]|uniref:Uncharacterized protein n=1 Tax=bioreactor metagenome TaxID=1076179 RepID=A0A645BBJ8_9ZZZZ
MHAQHVLHGLAGYADLLADHTFARLLTQPQHVQRDMVGVLYAHLWMSVGEWRKRVCAAQCVIQALALLFDEIGPAHGDSAVLQKVDAGAIEHVLVLDLHPMAALGDQGHAAMGQSFNQFACSANGVERIVHAPEAQYRHGDFVQIGGHVGNLEHRARGLRLRVGNGGALVDDLVGEQGFVEQLHLHDGAHRLLAGFAGLVDLEHVGNAGHGQIGVKVFHAARSHQDQPLHIPWMLERIAQCDCTAKRVAEQRDALEAELIDQAFDARDEKIEVILLGLFGLAGQAIAEQIGHDAAKARARELWVVALEVAVAAGAAARAVQEDDGLTRAHLVVMHTLGKTGNVADVDVLSFGYGEFAAGAHCLVSVVVV